MAVFEDVQHAVDMGLGGLVSLGRPKDVAEVLKQGFVDQCAESFHVLPEMPAEPRKPLRLLPQSLQQMALVCRTEWTDIAI
ncbi:hypothetical protein D3C78_1379430 [compost metagenome]